MDSVINPVTLNKSKLPDVDTSQPDTFETPDVESTTTNPQNTDIKENSNEDIDNSNVAVSDAFKKFADKKLESTEDYSSSVVRRRRIKKGGFVENQNAYEMAEVDAKDETPLQRFHRLQFEVKKLVQDLQNSKPEDKVVESAVGISQMTEELHLLQNNLSSLLHDEKLAPLLNPRYELEQASQLQEGLSKKLFSELSNFAAKTEKETSQAVSTSAAQPGVVTYELYYTPSTAKQMQAAQLVDLEKRIASLEQLIGLNKNVVPTAKNMVEAVEQLREKLNMLTPPHIDNVQKSVLAVSKDVDALVEKQKMVQPQANVEKKVNEIFELITKWDSVSEQLPAIVLRLKALRGLHEESASFSKNIKELESQQEEMKRLLKSDAELLKTVEENFKSNLTVVQTNVTTLETRFAEVLKKLEAKK